MPQGVWADVARGSRRLGDPGYHLVAVASVDRLPGHGAWDQRPFGPVRRGRPRERVGPGRSAATILVSPAPGF
jgi:hypothetical protein